MDLEKDESDDLKPSLCHDILTRILILLCDTDLRTRVIILRRRGKESDRKGYLRYLVRRFIFPAFPAAFCCCITIIGKSSFGLCSIISSFIWYFICFLLILYTFLNFHNSSGMSTSYGNGSTSHEKIRLSTIFSSATKYYKEHYNFF